MLKKYIDSSWIQKKAIVLVMSTIAFDAFIIAQLKKDFNGQKMSWYAP